MNRITHTISADHRDLAQCYHRIIDATDENGQTCHQNQFTWQLARHLVGEEVVLFPAMEKYIRDDPVIDEEQQDFHPHPHQQIKEKLEIFQDLHCSDPRFVPTITDLMDDLAVHIHTEETLDLVKLESAITAEESDRLARSFCRTKWFAPTRAHPSMPDRPPYATAAALITAPLDRLKDLFCWWPDPDLYLGPEQEE
ncbi:uncharacterized protein N7469_003289 [Penicillium citrinum]|uniref:Hemerythrin-like domain-containing protein n=1 Tax=Penicillium citrinum TaxID=5077 RepID=A0A9W9P287_PENCI|nr:uncharacterized protein N7469_003289 [Penicillium citrinum]KAJ5234121.1 hypothetical protein N7469_003289 [Penicillium citrinum]